MTENMKHWDALKTTDPKYTKKVEFGRKFTSINSQWQLQRMTEEFGPIGGGWGYEVYHTVERITDDYVLAIADVRIWWKDGEAQPSYGPVRGMSPIVEKTNAGKVVFDDDAGKKAMTDALTKGLSHLGLSADVFLGLFDDNKYVQKVREQFANGDRPAQIMHGLGPAAVQQAEDEQRAVFVGSPQTGDTDDYFPEEDKHLLKNGETRSTYQVATADKSPGRLAAELWASRAILLFKQPDYSLLDYMEWKKTPYTNKGQKTNEMKLAELREKHSDLADKIDEAVSNISAVAA